VFFGLRGERVQVTFHNIQLDQPHYARYGARPPRDTSLVTNELTTGQSNFTTGRIAAARGRFNRFRQVAPICAPCFYGCNRVHIPNGISIGSAAFARLTSYGRDKPNVRETTLLRL